MENPLETWNTWNIKYIYLMRSIKKNPNMENPIYRYLCRYELYSMGSINQDTTIPMGCPKSWGIPNSWMVYFKSLWKIE
jgi:hypothetical protein